MFGKPRRIGWIVFAAIILLAVLIERRIPVSLSMFNHDVVFTNWSRTIGELAHVAPANRIWLIWAGYLVLVTPILIWLVLRQRLTPPLPIVAALVATYCLTIWQARWGYFFVSIFAISLPALLGQVKSRAAVWIAFGLSIFPILQFWDARIWPNEEEIVTRIERRTEARDLRALAATMRSDQTRAFLAPWWLSPSISYWSGQPGVAGSSHEALSGIADAARFFVDRDPTAGRKILQRRQVEWVVAYDWDRVARNSADLLGLAPAEHALGRILDRTPASAPPDLVLSGQNQTAKLFRFADKL
jgi:hypothetical protein